MLRLSTIVFVSSLAILGLGEATISSTITLSTVLTGTSFPSSSSTTVPAISSILQEMSLSQDGYNLFFASLCKEEEMPLAVESSNASTESASASSLMEEDSSCAGSFEVSRTMWKGNEGL